MANNYNSFGATTADVVELYPNVNATDMGGTAVIQNEMDRAVRRLVNAIPERLHRLLTYRVELERLAGPAYEGEGPTFTLGMGPITDTSTLKLYIVNSYEQPACPLFPEDNQSGTLSGSGNQTLTLTSPRTTLEENDWLFATYVIDPTDAAFSIPSFADYVIYSTAATMGRKLFDQATDSWELVLKYERMAGDGDGEGIFQRLQSGQFITDQIRALEFCEEVEAAGDGINSLGKKRG